MKAELIVFDLAGTTVKDNKDVHRVLQSALKQFGIEISIAQANEVMGIPKPIAIKQLLEEVKFNSITEEFIMDVHKKFIEEMIDFYQNDSGVGEKSGVSATFQKLKQNGIRVVVDTGFDRQITNALLARLAWKENGLIDASVTSDEVERGRPFPDMIYKAMELVGVSDVKTVAKVGDTASDLEEGNSAGCSWVIGVTSGAFTERQLLEIRHTHLIHEIPELLKILKID